MPNCLTYSLRLPEDEVTHSRVENLDWLLPPIEALSLFSKKYHRNVRLLENKDSELIKGEWKIAFFGYIPINRDYEGRPTMYDYHLVRKNSDGTWSHRKTWDADPDRIDMEEMSAEYTKIGYPPMYFAIRETES